MRPTKFKKYELFKQLHEREGAFVIPNPWDAGSARILAGLGFEALATTSAGFAFSIGCRDSFSALSRNQVLENAKSIVNATDLPVTADLENGFGNTPEDCRNTILAAAEIGLVGGSIEDATGDENNPIYELAHAVERISAAVEARREHSFLLTARAENFLWGKTDFNDTMTRIQAYAEAGADVVYAPGLPDLESIKTLCREVDKPVNVVMGLSGFSCNVNELSEIGVKRISVGGSFARAALGELVRAATEVRDEGTFLYSSRAIPDAEAAAYMSQAKKTQ